MIEINLLPSEIMGRKKNNNLILFTVLSVLPIIFMCIILFFSLEKVINSVQGELAWTKEKTREYQPLLNQLQELKDKKTELQLRLIKAKDVVVNRYPWSLVLYEISRSLPDSIWLTRLAKNIEGKDQLITIEGSTLNQTMDIGKFMDNLNKSSLFQEMTISLVTKGNIEETEIMTFTAVGKLK